MIHALQTLLVLALPALVITAALRDLTSYTIPNWIPLSLAAAFLPAALAAQLPWAAVGGCAAVGAVALACAVAMFAAGWIGGGDAKLFAAAALWLGLPGAPAYLAVIGAAGGALAVGLLAMRAPLMQPIAARGPAWFRRLSTEGESVPYGFAIAVGALAAFPASPLFVRVLAG